MGDVQICSKRFINERVTVGKATLQFVGGVCMHVEGELGEAEVKKIVAQPDLFQCGDPEPVKINIPGMGEEAPAPPPAECEQENAAEVSEEAEQAEEAAAEAVVTSPAPAPAAPASANDPLMLLTANEIRAKLDSFGVEYGSKDAKPVLAGLLRKATDEAAAKVEGPVSDPTIRPDRELLTEAKDGDEPRGQIPPALRNAL
jgi:hypothetical protein